VDNLFNLIMEIPISDILMQNNPHGPTRTSTHLPGSELAVKNEMIRGR